MGEEEAMKIDIGREIRECRKVKEGVRSDGIHNWNTGITFPPTC